MNNIDCLTIMGPRYHMLTLDYKTTKKVCHILTIETIFSHINKLINGYLKSISYVYDSHNYLYYDFVASESLQCAEPYIYVHQAILLVDRLRRIQHNAPFHCN